MPAMQLQLEVLSEPQLWQLFHGSANHWTVGSGECIALNSKDNVASAVEPSEKLWVESNEGQYAKLENWSLM